MLKAGWQRLVVFGAGSVWLATALASLQPGLQVVRQALFQPADATTWQAVRLPHDWPAPVDGRPLRQATYVLAFDAGSRAPGAGEVWAMSVRRLSTRYRISIDGQLVAAAEAGHADQLPQHVHDLLVEIPPALLHAGRNLMTLQIDAEQGRGLAPIRIGPRDAVLAENESYEALHLSLPQLVNAATVPFALALIVLWVVRRQESAPALFALCWLPTALRNHGVYLAAAAVGSDAVRVSVVLGRVGSAILFTLFAISVSQWRWPRLRRLCWASLAGLMLAVAVAIAAGRLAEWRHFIYPLGIPFLILAVGILGLRLRRERLRVVVLFAVVGLAVVAAGLHDELMVMGRLGIEAEEWLPWVTPLVFIGVSSSLLARAARAMDEVAALNLRLERRVAERTTELLAANAAKTRFLASASHDLRQPLHAISLLAAVLSRRASQPEILDLCERLDTTVSGMQAMLDSVLDVSSLDAGTEAPHFEALPVAGMLARVAHDLGPAAAERGLALRVRPTRLWVRSDATMLARILQNLVANAIQYTPAGGVLLAARARGEQVLIEVWDTGIGIPADQHEAVFDEFVQLANPARDRRKGVGLGLAIVRRMAVLIGARVALASRPDQGSVFRLWLPRVAMDLPPPGRGTAAGSAHADASGLFVVVIDDDEVIRFAMTALLSELGCRVVAAASSREAIDQLARHLRAPDAAIVDYRLETESGHAAITALRCHLDGPLPVALVTGDLSVPQDVDAALPPPVVMRKPVAAGALQDWLAGVKRSVEGGHADRPPPQAAP